MSLTKETIQHLEDNKAVTEQLASLEACEKPIAFLPKDYSVVDLEKYMPERARFRGMFSTASLTDFANYTNKKQADSCFINTETMCAKSIFDLGTETAPGHAEHKASLTLKQTAPFQEALKIDGIEFNQKRFAEWLEDWRMHITAYGEADGEKIDLKKAISAVRNLTIKAASNSTHTDSSLGRSKSSLESVDIESTEKLPMFFEFECETYENLKTRKVNFRVSILASHEAPTFMTRIVRREKLEEEILKEFREKLAEAMNNDVDIYLGNMLTD